MWGSFKTKTKLWTCLAFRYWDFTTISRIYIINQWTDKAAVSGLDMLHPHFCSELPAMPCLRWWGRRDPSTHHHVSLPCAQPSILALGALRVVLSQESGMAGVIMIHAVENRLLVFWKLAVAQVWEAGKGVWPRMSLLLSETDSFIGPQNLRVWKLLSLGGRTIRSFLWLRRALGWLFGLLYSLVFQSLQPLRCSSIPGCRWMGSWSR